MLLCIASRRKKIKEVMSKTIEIGMFGSSAGEWGIPFHGIQQSLPIHKVPAVKSDDKFRDG